MPTPDEAIQLYLKLADAHDRLARAQERDRFLFLAADTALTAGRQEQAERLRRDLLSQNPNHMLRPYGTLKEAMTSPDISAYVHQLRRSYSFERSEHLLETLRGELAQAKPKRATEGDFFLPLDLGDAKGMMQVKPAREAPKASRKEVRPMPEKPAKPAPMKPLPAKPAAPAVVPDIFNFADKPGPRLSPAASAAAGAKPAPPREEVQPGAWLCSLLFLVTLALAVALLGYTLVGPFVK